MHTYTYLFQHLNPHVDKENKMYQHNCKTGILLSFSDNGLLVVKLVCCSGPFVKLTTDLFKMTWMFHVP